MTDGINRRANEPSLFFFPVSPVNTRALFSVSFHSTTVPFARPAT